MKPRIVNWSPSRPSPLVRSLLERPAASEADEATATAILRDVAREGDKAVIRYARRFDGCALTPTSLRVSPVELASSAREIPTHWRRAIEYSHARVLAFALAGLRNDWELKLPDNGGTVGERFLPLDRAGIYIPGGAAPLASTVLMTVPLAQAAGVRDIVVCTPSAPDGAIHPAIRFALHLAGATEVYRLGGVQAIAAMALGTQSLRPVQIIVGPGNRYVTAAKRLVYGRVALDMLAGPSEIVILADHTATPAFIAADLLSQAEHGSGHEKAVLVTTSRRIAIATAREVERQAARLGRRAHVEKVLKNGTALVVVPSIDDGIELCNRLAPEHLEVMTRSPRSLRKRLTRAGAIFEGPWSPEPAGDFAAGPSHVLPTGGTAASFSGLTAETFRRRTSLLAISRSGLRAMAPSIQAFAEMEGLDAHGRSGAIRFE